jgi:hypothetical protein
MTHFGDDQRWRNLDDSPNRSCPALLPPAQAVYTNHLNTDTGYEFAGTLGLEPVVEQRQVLATETGEAE